MKTLNKALLALVAGSLVTVGAQAAVNTAQPYVGVKVGQYDLDGADDEAVSYGAFAGAQLTPFIGVEGEYLTTSKEDYNATSEYDAEVYGLYATATYPVPNSPVYAKGRIGVAETKIDADNSVNGFSGKNKDSGFAGGLGLGYNVTPNAAVEVAYEWYPSVFDGDKDYDANGITLGASYKF